MKDIPSMKCLLPLYQSGTSPFLKTRAFPTKKNQKVLRNFLERVWTDCIPVQPEVVGADHLRHISGLKQSIYPMPTYAQVLI